MSRKNIILIVSAVCFVALVALVILIVRFSRNHWSVQQVKIATAAEWGEYYKFGTALARVVERHNPRLKVTVVKTDGSVQNMDLLAKGEVDFAIAQNNVLTEATAEPASVRAVATLFPEVFHLIAAKNSGIKELSDLRGKRVALMPGGSGSHHLFLQILAQHELSKEDVTIVSLECGKVAEMLREGKVDAVCHTLALGNDVVRGLLEATDAYLVPLTNVEAMQIWIPYLVPCAIPAGTYGQHPAVPAQDIPTAGVRAMLLTHEDVNHRLVFDMAEVLDRFHPDLVTEYPYAAAMASPFAEGACVPQHPGAIDYSHREDPSFMVKYAEFIALLVTIAILIGTGLLRLHMYVRDQRKDRADKYNLQIIRLLEKVHTTQDIAGLETARTDLLKIFRDMIEDLDNDRITMEFFPSFAFTWEMVFREIHHREDALREKQKA